LSTTETSWTVESVRVAGQPVTFRRAGAGDPLLLLHHDVGRPPAAPFFDLLARQFTVYVPSHPGYDGSERLDWLRNVRDVAVIYQGLLAERGVSGASLVGLGFGGWIAAEMAGMAPRDLAALVLVGAMGIKPPEGDILDQAIVGYIDYARAGFHDQKAFERAYGAEPSNDQLVAWDICREMSFRIAWKPYMYSQTLPHLLGAVRAPALLVWGADDKVVPVSAGRRYAEALANAKLHTIAACGHCAEIEKPDELAALVTSFLG